MIEVEPHNPAILSSAEQRVCLSIADIRIALRCDEQDLTLALGGEFALFRAVDGPVDASVGAGWGDLSDERGGAELLFDSGALWQLFRETDGYLWRFQTPYFGATPYKIARFNQDYSQGTVTLHRPFFKEGVGVNPLEYPLDELLMLNLLAQGRGVEIHSCGIVDEAGNGYLFAGQSGAGKTTTARLWEARGGISILSDDRIIVRRIDGEFWIYGTPWHGEGELARPERARLKRIFFLQHGERNELTPLGGAEASARLFSCSFPTFYQRDGLAFTLSFFDELTSSVPTFELSFVPDQGAVDFIRQQAG